MAIDNVHDLFNVTRVRPSNNRMQSDASTSVVSESSRRSARRREGHFSPRAVFLEKEGRAEKLFRNFFEIQISRRESDGSDDDPFDGVSK